MDISAHRCSNMTVKYISVLGDVSPIITFHEGADTRVKIFLEIDDIVVIVAGLREVLRNSKNSDLLEQSYDIRLPSQPLAHSITP